MIKFESGRIRKKNFRLLFGSLWSTSKRNCVSTPMSMSSSLIQRSAVPLLRYLSNKINLKCHPPVISYCCRHLHSSVKDKNRVATLEKLSPKDRKAVFAYEPESMELVEVTKLMAADPTLQVPDYFQVHNLFTVRDLFEARVHLGHKIGSLNARMTPFIYGHRFESVIFDLDITAYHLRQALNFMAHIAYRKGIILFVTRSANTMNMVEKTAIEVGEYAHCRLYEPSILTDSTNKFGGMTRLPDLIIMMNTLDTVMAPHEAIRDASKMLIPTVGIVDSNCDPNLISYPVPGNDDSIVSVEFYLKVFKEAILRGKHRRKLNDSQTDKESK